MDEQEVIDKAYEEAKKTIDICSTKYGFYASGGKNGYKGVWARDSMITLIGAASDEKQNYHHDIKRSLSTMGKYQSKMGQIPNAILNLHKPRRKVDFKSVDSSLWYIIGHFFNLSKYKDKNFYDEHDRSVRLALTWLQYRDYGEDTTIEQLPTTDWQDAFPQKYGTVMSTQALYYKTLELMGKKKDAEKLKHIVNDVPGERLWNSEFYWAYRWKNHNKYKEIGEWFDSFGNMLAILFDLADKKRAKSILNYVRKHRISSPYPMKSISPPIDKSSLYWEDYYYDAGATPNHYLNGGIWPYIGGLYVLALVKMKMYDEARKELVKLAHGNMKGNPFPEWIDPVTEKTHGIYQAWSAGTYMWAYNSLKRKKFLM
ncbi:MAG TPA: glycoside hydrolase 100 family protein [Candidatus Nanoarchaeia archaeon]|nr:glycoside hydrolase 100 family protein [Candidatus Nanoarchaeia archaeon]